MPMYYPRHDQNYKRLVQTLLMSCNDEPLSEIQFKAYQNRLMEYRDFLESVNRLALCANVCVTEEPVSIGENGLLSEEALNALQHAGAISVYNVLQQNNWEYPITKDTDVAVIRSHNAMPDEFLDSDTPIRADWPSVHLNQCFIEGDRAKLHGLAQPLRFHLPPTIAFRSSNAQIVDDDDDQMDDQLDPTAGGAAGGTAGVIEVNDGMGGTTAVATGITANSIQAQLGQRAGGSALNNQEGAFDLVGDENGYIVKRYIKDGKEAEFIPLNKFFYGRKEGTTSKKSLDSRDGGSGTADESKAAASLSGGDDATETERDGAAAGGGGGGGGEYRFRCHQCQETLFSNTALIQHMLEHLDDPLMREQFRTADHNQCTHCGHVFSHAFELREHTESCHPQVVIISSGGGANPDDPHSDPSGAATTEHQQQVFTCCICENSFDSRFGLAFHLKDKHRYMEMPYRCGVCAFHSSIYMDLLDHFKKFHDNTNQLLCPYCLRNFEIKDAHPQNSLLNAADKTTNPQQLSQGVGQTQAYYSHLRMHRTPNQFKLCTYCQLSFVNKHDYQMHRKLDHRSQTLAAATTAAGSTTATSSSSTMSRNPASGLFEASSNNGGTSAVQSAGGGGRGVGMMGVFGEAADSNSGHHLEEAAASGSNLKRKMSQLAAGNENAGKLARTAAGMLEEIEAGESQGGTAAGGGGGGVKKLNAPETSRVRDFTNLVLCEEAAQLECIECRERFTVDQHRRYLPCSACRFATCCAQAFNRHVKEQHGGGEEMKQKQKKKDAAAEGREGEEEEARQFYCTGCAASKLSGNELARHLVEQCDQTVVTMEPDPRLLEARQQAERDSAILFSSDNRHPGETVAGRDGGGAATEGETAAGAGSVVLANVGEEEMQSIVIPEDVQLEEGQVLMLIQGDDGQQQLAIINQDMLDSIDPYMIMQSAGNAEAEANPETQ